MPLGGGITPCIAEDGAGVSPRAEVEFELGSVAIDIKGATRAGKAFVSAVLPADRAMSPTTTAFSQSASLMV